MRALVITPARVKVKMRLVVPSSVTAAGETANLTVVSSLVIVPMTGVVVATV